MGPRLFEELVVSNGRKRGSGYALPASIAIHAAVLSAVVIVPVLTSAAMPEPPHVLVPLPIPVIDPPPPPAGAPAPSISKPRRVVVRRDVSVPQPQPLSAETSAPVDEPVGAGSGEVDPLPGPVGCQGCVEGGDPNAGAAPIYGTGGTPPPEPVPVGALVRPPRKVRHVDPVYPETARTARIRGTVTLECIIATSGRVTDVRVVSGIPPLNAAAVDAVQQWVYEPSLLKGVPVPVIMTVTVRFNLY